VRLIAPYPAGGSSDLVARIVAQKLSESLGRQLVVDNRSGGGGITGTELAARAAPDGHTLLLGNIGPLAITVPLTKQLGYDPRTDFAPISLLAVSPTMLVLHPSVPAKSVAELVTLAKAQPGKLNYGSSGVGTTPYIATELFKQMAGVDIVNVSYKGSGQAVNDLLGGQIQVMFASMPVGLQHSKSGRLRALAVTGAKRSTLAPEFPTLAEAGVPGYAFDTWWGLLAPARTPSTIVDRLNADVKRALDLPDVKARFADLGIEAAYGTPAQYGAFVRAEVERFTRIVQQLGLKPE
jgi:tripartite-type tricarboxylate transporter receptor subunit TctC